jgi:Ca-activated chloride channel family protein
MTGHSKGIGIAMLSLIVISALLTSQSKAGVVQGIEPGSLIATGKEGIVLPLKGTTVNADVSGFGARVTVVQTFTNPSSQPIEAVYTFPLPAEAAVDRMRMQVGDRIIDGVIKRRDEARVVYEAAKSHGQAAALLDQERPNIFTQSVANILPKAVVKIEISYVQLLKYEEGEFEFNFPMVVGPRYLGNAPDPGKISPPVIPNGMRTGSNISITVNLEAGAPVLDVKSVLHEVSSEKMVATPLLGGARGLVTSAPGSVHYRITLKHKDEIPNKDFILKYRMATDTVQSALLAKYDPVKGGYFSLILLPPKAPTRQQIANRELIYVIDQTGSQTGFPIAKSIELTLKLMQTMRPGDTFNVMGFTTGVNPLWKQSRPNTAENRAIAQSFVKKLDAGGGTDIRNAIETAYAFKPDPDRLRLFIFNSDGYVGDDSEILHAIHEHHDNSRLFTFGIGNSVNRYLIDAMSEEGKGDSEIVTLASQCDDAVARFVQRTQSPILVNVGAKFEGVAVSEVLPDQIPDVFSSKPIVIYGRYAAPGMGRLTLSGRMAGKPWSQSINIVFPSDQPGGESIPTIWARRMVDKIERDYALGTQQAKDAHEGENKVTDLALEYGIMSQYTSFVAVEQRVINIGGKQRTVHVPVEMADGVSREGIGLDSINNHSRGAIFGGTTKGSFIRAGSMQSMNLGGQVGGAGGGAGGGRAAGAYAPASLGGFDGGGVRLTGGTGLVPSGLTLLNYDTADKSFTIGGTDEALQEFIKVVSMYDPKFKVVNMPSGAKGARAKVYVKPEVAKALFGEKPETLIEQRRLEIFNSKVDSKLRRAAGLVEVEIWMEDLTDATMAKLKAAGLSIDEQAKSLKVVFGRCDSKALMELAQLEKVVRIEPIT